MKWLNKWLFKVNYADQVLDTKILDILDRLDSYLSEHSAVVTDDSVMVIKAYKIALFSQILPVVKVLGNLRSKLPETFIYIPRSIAFIHEFDGTWTFFVALRETGSSVDEIVSTLFIDALIRTNAARSISDKNSPIFK